MNTFTTQLKHLVHLTPLSNAKQTHQTFSKDILVFSHLRWDFVTQRPQHIMKRMAKSHRIFFIEEPIHFTEKDQNTACITKAEPNIFVVQPKVSWEHLEEGLDMVVSQLMHQYKVEKPTLWFYSARFGEMVYSTPHTLVVYDCMDELAAFKGAPPELLQMERDLLRVADVVFTGGKSLYESKAKYHTNVHCFPSSVDKKHFEKSLQKSTSIPEDIAHIRKPVVGFYGVVDERMDLVLLRKVAESCPHISFVVIGPVVKIEMSDLPMLPNIHYLGAKSYEELPNYLKAFDIAMMPFALNASTKFISPTKTLEFMAAHKPIISTPIYDVRRDYQKEVFIARTAEEFKQAIEYYINESPAQRNMRVMLQQAVIERTSWDRTVAAMKQIMQGASTQLVTKHEDVGEQLNAHTVLAMNT